MTNAFHRPLLGIVALCALIASALIIGTTAPASAAGGIVVNSSADNTTSGDNVCTLREAVNAAQGTDNDCGTDVDGETITFASGVTNITLNGSELPSITGAVVIDGGGTTAGGTVTIDANHASRIAVISSGSLTVENLTLINGSPAVGDGQGGIILNHSTLTVTDCILSGGRTYSDPNNVSEDIGGGAIYNFGTLNVSGSTFTDNTAGDGGASGGSRGGAIYVISGTGTIDSSTFSGNHAYDSGGAIGSQRTVIVTNSTFSGNSAADNGGAIDSSAPFAGNGVTVINSTFSGNTASEGSAISHTGKPLTLLNSTLSGNTATAVGGGALATSAGTATITNTIVANNTGGDCGTGTFSGTHNLASDDTCTSGVFTQSSTIKLGPLADNGGPTQTMLPLTGSSSIDAGDATVCADTTTVNGLDQRGVVRPQGSACDIGAVEVAAQDVGGLTAAISSHEAGYGEPATLSFTGLPGGATGTITFKTPDGTVVCTATLPATSCTSDPSLPVGTAYTDIRAYYSGDTTHNPGASGNTVDLNVVKATPVITAIVSNSNPVYGQSASFALDGLPTDASGTVTFKAADGTVVCTVDLSLAKTCTSDPNLPAGTTYTDIAAYYSANGDPNYNDATSTNTVDLTVAKASTTITATATYNNSSSGPTVAIHASVVSNDPSNIDLDDEGTVSFYNGTTLLCTVPVGDGDADCVAPIDASTGAPHNLRAVYSGSDNYTGSSATTDVVEHLAQPTLVSVTTVSTDDGTAWLVTGGGFSGGSSATVCGVSVPFTVINDNTLLVGIPPVNGPQQCGITVTAAGGTGSTSGNVTVIANPVPGAPVVIYPTGPTTTPPPTTGICTATTIGLNWRWTLIGWPGKTMPVVDALSGTGWTCTNNILPDIQVVWGFDAATQTWHAFFPDYTDIPGANDLDNLEYAGGYFIALKDQTMAPVTWEIVEAS